MEQILAYSRWLLDILKSFGCYVTVFRQELSIVVPAHFLYKILFFLCKSTNAQFEVFTDLVCVDYPFSKKRFTLNYLLLSIRFSQRVNVKIQVSENEHVSSGRNLFKGITWYEREVFDMFGVFFNNFELRRLLTDYGFEGHPLRKNFPLSGFVEVRYDLEKNRVICENLSLSQEFRYFRFSSAKNQYNKGAFFISLLALRF